MDRPFKKSKLTGNNSTKNILVLGSGMVAPPCIKYLSRNTNNRITIGGSANHSFSPSETEQN